jgi:hypothetical protein
MVVCQWNKMQCKKSEPDHEGVIVVTRKAMKAMSSNWKGELVQGVMQQEFFLIFFKNKPKQAQSSDWHYPFK